MRPTKIFGFFILSLCSVANADKVIPMSDSLYQGKYFLLENTKQNGINKITYKSVFKAGTVFSKMEINCSTGKYRNIGEGKSLENISTYSNKGNWIYPVDGASDQDVLKYVCKKSS